MDLANKFLQYDALMTSDYFSVSIKLCPEVGNDKYIVLCNIGGRSMSGFYVIEGGGGGRASPRSQEAKKARSEKG